MLFARIGCDELQVGREVRDFVGAGSSDGGECRTRIGFLLRSEVSAACTSGSELLTRASNDRGDSILGFHNLDTFLRRRQAFRIHYCSRNRNPIGHPLGQKSVDRMDSVQFQFSCILFFYWLGLPLVRLALVAWVLSDRSDRGGAAGCAKCKGLGVDAKRNSDKDAAAGAVRP